MTATFDPRLRIVEGYSDRFPDIPIYIIKSREDAKRFLPKGKRRKWRVTVQIEALEEE